MLYGCGARNWGHHARTASTAIQLIITYLESGARLSAYIQAIFAFKRYSSNLHDSQDVPRHRTGVHVAEYFGLKEVIMPLLENGHDLDDENTSGKTALVWAARQGHKAAVELLRKALSLS